MKITLSMGFNGGQLLAEADTFAEVDQIIQYALKRGILYATPDQRQDDDPVEEVTVEEVVETAPVTAEQAREKMKAYAAQNGIEKGRELLARFGLKRTSEITDEMADAIVEACHE